MTEKEFSEDMTYLGLAYGKEFTPNELRVYYDFLKDYSDETLMKAIKNIIKESKFLPKVTELIEACDKYKEKTKFDILIFMNQKGYFKVPEEYDKAVRFLETGIVPDWFKKDMNMYYKMMKQGALTHQDTKMLGV